MTEEYKLRLQVFYFKNVEKERVVGSHGLKLRVTHPIHLDLLLDTLHNNRNQPRLCS